MAISIRCSQCATRLRADEKHAGKSKRCPCCRTPVRVPVQSPTNSVADTHEESTPAPSWLLQTPMAAQAASRSVVPVVETAQRTSPSVCDSNENDTPGFSKLDQPLAWWLRLYEDGSFQAGTITYPQHSAVRVVVHSTRLLKEPGTGQTLVLIKDKHRVELIYREGRWLHRWTTPTRLSIHSAPIDAQEPAVVDAAPSQPNEPEAVASRGWVGLLAPLPLIALILAVSFLGRLQVIPMRHFQFDDQTWTEQHAYHTLCTYAFFSPQAAELFYLVNGVLLFGWLVGRNIGVGRTLALFLWSALLGVGLWRFLHTSLGQAIMHDILGKLFAWLCEKTSLTIAWQAWLMFLEAYDTAMSLRGPVSGAMGAVSGLITFATCYRPATESRFPARWLAVGLGTVYLGLGWFWLWPVVLHQPAPYILFVGGALGGWIFCFPDKALKHFGDSLKNALRQQGEQLATTQEPVAAQQSEAIPERRVV